MSFELFVQSTLSGLLMGAMYALIAIPLAMSFGVMRVLIEAGIVPDVIVMSKGIGNGFPIAAIVGRHAVMDAAQETFVSSTAWTERVGPVAALATLKKHREQNVAKHLMRIGTRVQRA